MPKTQVGSCISRTHTRESTLSAFGSTVKFIRHHPLGGLGGIVRFFRWQILSRLHGGSTAFVPWIDDSVLAIRRGEHGLTGNIYCGLHEFEEMSFFLCVLREGDLFVDVGANGGSYTVLASKVRGCRVLAFEPAPLNHKVLLRNLRANNLLGLVEAQQEAVADFSGSAYMTSSAGATSRLVRDPDQATEESIPVIRLDDAVDCGAGRVFIKIDVEGGEEGVIRGATNLLQSPETLALCVEVSWDGDELAPESQRVVEFLESLSYQIFHFSPPNNKFRRGPEKASRNVIASRDLELLSARIGAARAVNLRVSEPWIFSPTPDADS